LADQAFGKPQEAEEDKPEDDILAGLTREQRAVIRSFIEENKRAEQGESSDRGSQAGSLTADRHGPFGFAKQGQA
jgi:hypothetical protein